ncbi:MAG: hypothetical protein EA360_11820 [Balneolaceae bacterium]|nr:MAG: hypothetical protein EA360_11820 [Balneolaceae bacterium]
MSFFQTISERLQQFFSEKKTSLSDESHSSVYEGREKLIAFGIALFFAICLWMIVNLNRDFNVVVEVPIQLSSLAEDISIVSDLPATASVNLIGEGWKLISIYTNPPKLTLTAESGEVNLMDMIRNQVGAFSDLNIIQVYPASMRVETERRVAKRVPVQSRVGISTRARFGLIAEPVIIPDSITITGAETLLDEITYWETAETTLSDISSSSRHRVQLKAAERGIVSDSESVLVQLQVAEFTEAELRVPIRTRNLPGGSAVTYNPASITVRFDIPIDQYSDIQRIRLFQAFVDYTLLEEDDSGFIIPEVELIEEGFNARLRSFQPPRVAYFRIVSD